MMEEDYDEDVIFENSPLYQHLKEAGVSDIDVEPVRKSGKDATDQRGWKQTGQPAFSNIAHVCRRCLDYITSLFQRRKNNDRLLQCYQHQVLSTLCSSHVLVEEDQLFLQDFAGREVISNGRQVLPLARSWIKHLVPSMLLPVLLASIVARLKDSTTSYTLTFDLGLCLSCVMGVVYMATVARDYQRRRHYDWLCSSLRDFLDTSHSLLTLTRKSLRLIQETELVARGFTLVSQKSAVSQLDQKPSASTMRQCPDLRRCLFMTTRSTTLMWREATLSLLDLLIKEIDSISHYLCGISLEEYGPCLHPHSEEEEGEVELYHLTDGYAVAALKAMTELFSLHLSEFVRRLALCFSPPSQLCDQDVYDPFNTLQITSKIQETLRKKELSLHRLYDFHKCSPQGRQPKPHYPHNKQTSQTEEFYIAVHSLDLHLQSAITRVRDLANEVETKLEEGASTNQNGDNAESANEKWESFMSGVKAELEACKGCWEEGMSQLERSKKQVPKLDDLPDMSARKPESKAILFAEIGDPIIEDQVFEAYTDPDEVDTGSWSWEPILSPEEREKKKREKQEALRLLTELKSVISVRAKDREKREQVALNRMVKGKTTLAQSDNKLPHVETKPSNTSREDKGICDDNGQSLGVELDQFSKHTNGDDCDKDWTDELPKEIHDSLSSEPRIETTQEESNLLSELEERGVNLDDGQLSDEPAEKVQYDRLEDVVKYGSCDTESSHTLQRESEDKNPLSDAYNSDISSCITFPGIVKHKNSCSVGDSENIPHHGNGNEKYFKEKHVAADIDPNKVTSAPYRVLSAPEGHDLVDRSELKERLERIHGANLGFTANVAAMAAARSATLKLTEQTFGDTFGDSSSENEEEDIIG